jgi:hypothetical protein
MIGSLDEKHTKIDPENSSIREEMLSLRSDPSNPGKVFIDENTGEKFYKLKIKPSKQRLVALVLKGVVNVSDVVKVGDTYYSHMQDFSALKSKQEDLEHEIEASIAIIYLITGDIDHGIFSEVLHPDPDSNQEHHNLILNKLEKKFNFFDFDLAFNNISYDMRAEEDYYFRYYCDRLISLINNPKKDKSILLKILNHKLDILERLFSSDSFESFKKLVERSGIEWSGEQTESVFRKIQSRISVLREVIKV